MTSSLAKGDAFRDLVDEVLTAAGFRTRPESRLVFKKVDNIALWTRDELQGSVRYLFETKDYDGTLPKAECVEFITEYGSLVRSRDADQAWLISKGPISPDGKALIDNEPGLQCLTFLEFQRRLLLLETYLRDLVEERAQQRLPEYYIPPETLTGEDLEQKVRAWVAEANASPLFILGPYGKGKSTFATHIAAEFARAALADPTQRAPILVRLGEVVDEQSLDGLLGKVLASRYRVSNYHFETFRALNRLGRFLVIYDAFDEMKHGMTFSKFQTVLAELMRIDEGDARILVLGRDTALHDDVEFRAIIDGRQITGAGREVPDPRRRPYRTAQIRGFTVQEAHLYVRRYFPIRASQIAEQRGADLDADWVAGRINHLLSGDFDSLLERPVHAQMLCEIAAYPESKLQNLTVYELFDTFVHYLLDRETRKKGRHGAFDIPVRRAFNGSLAWWLWERGGASTTTLGDVPTALCTEAVHGVAHDLDEVALKRELIQGCLIEKSASTIYFGHRSLQEFLVADHLIATNLLEGGRAGVSSLERVFANVTPEIIEFIVAGVQTTSDRHQAALGWFDRLVSYRGVDVPLVAFHLFTRLAQALNVQVNDVAASPWLVWLEFFRVSGATDFAQRQRNTYNVLADLLRTVQKKGQEAQAAAAYALARVLQHAGRSEEGAALALAAMIPVEMIKTAIAAVRGKRSSRYPLRRDANFLLWSFLRASTVSVDGQVEVAIDVRTMLNDAQRALRMGLQEDSDAQGHEVIVSAQALYRALASLKVSDRDIDAIRPYFGEFEVRASITPLEVEIVPKKPPLAVSAPKFYGGGEAVPAPRKPG